MYGAEGIRSVGISMREKENLSIRDLANELAESPIRSNRIVERFLFHRVTDKGLNCGTNCAGDIHSFMKRENIPVPGGVNPKLWINRAIWDASRNGNSPYFIIKEIDGTLSGINFSWWYLDGKTKPEIDHISKDIRIRGSGDNAGAHVCKG